MFVRLHAVAAAGFPLLASGLVSGQRVSDDATLQRIRLTWEQDSYLACPHTAVALEAVEAYRKRTGTAGPAVVLATAHPAKFPEVSARALPVVTPESAVLDELAGLPVSVQKLEPDLAALREVLLQR
jgi:threonine synthase